MNEKIIRYNNDSAWLGKPPMIVIIWITKITNDWFYGSKNENYTYYSEYLLKLCIINMKLNIFKFINIICMVNLLYKKIIICNLKINTDKNTYY